MPRITRQLEMFPAFLKLLAGRQERAAGVSRVAAAMGMFQPRKREGFVRFYRGVAAPAGTTLTATAESTAGRWFARSPFYAGVYAQGRSGVHNLLDTSLHRRIQYVDVHKSQLHRLNRQRGATERGFNEWIVPPEIANKSRTWMQGAPGKFRYTEHPHFINSQTMSFSARRRKRVRGRWLRAARGSKTRALSEAVEQSERAGARPTQLLLPFGSGHAGLVESIHARSVGTNSKVSDQRLRLARLTPGVRIPQIPQPGWNLGTRRAQASRQGWA